MRGELKYVALGMVHKLQTSISASQFLLFVPVDFVSVCVCETKSFTPVLSSHSLCAHFIV